MDESVERLELLEFEEEGGEIRFGLELPIPPFGNMTVVADDDTGESQALLEMLSNSWSILWPAMLEQLREGMANLDLEIETVIVDCTAYVSTLRQGFFMANKCDVYLSFKPTSESPDWDFFLKNAEIVHFQPVF